MTYTSYVKNFIMKNHQKIHEHGDDYICNTHSLHTQIQQLKYWNNFFYLNCSLHITTRAPTRETQQRIRHLHKNEPTHTIG